MPHFSSGCGSSAGTTTSEQRSPSELIRLWRSRLSTSDIKTTDSRRHHHHHHHDPPPQQLPPPLEGVLSQQPKMSEAQEVSSAVERRESDASEITRQKSEIDEEESEQQDVPETPKSDSASTPRDQAPTASAAAAAEKKQLVETAANAASVVADQPPTSTKPTAAAASAATTNPRVGECNLLPVLVERLRSALELSYCSDSSAITSAEAHQQQQQLPLEDSGVDSEEDLRLWNGIVANTAAADGGKPKLDLKFLEDILLADIHTALARLQDTLKRVDIGTLTRYNASLDPSNKLYLLRLISNLLAKLKVPEEAILGNNKSPPSEAPSNDKLPAASSHRRRKNERHTIGVSAEDLSRAKRWFDEKSSTDSSPTHPRCVGERLEAPLPQPSPSSSNTQAVVDEALPSMKPTFSDKCMKDAINQQQCKSNREQFERPPFERLHLQPRRSFDGIVRCKDDSSVVVASSGGHHHQPQINNCIRHNKFTAKKSKIKRANTIDIPNYLKLKTEHSPERLQNGCFALRRPIDVGDRLLANSHHQKVVPSFEPKTDNDRKFLALINKNNAEATTTPTNSGNCTGNAATGSPFKSFNYRQAATVADKNWSNRFWNIKTNFDKPRSENGDEQPPRKPGKLDARSKFENKPIAVDDMRCAKQQQQPPVNGFSHAPSSPFQKIEKPIKQQETSNGPPFLKAAAHMPKNSSMLQAKLKMFDQEPVKLANLETRNKSSKFGKPPETKNKPQPIENGQQLNYYSFCKQFAPFASGRSNSLEGKSNVNSTKSKLLENIQKEADKPPEPKASHTKPKAPLISSADHDFSKQYSYHKPCYDAYNHQDPYRQLDKKPQFNRGFQPQENDKSSLRRFVEAAPTQNVAVQTSHLDRRPSVPEPASVDNKPELKRNSVSVQTTSPSPLPSAPLNNNFSHSTANPGNYQPPRKSSFDSYAGLHYPYKNATTPTETTRTSPQLGISQKLYNEFSKLPEVGSPTTTSFDYIPYADKDEIGCNKIQNFKVPSFDQDHKLNVVEENIENQDISSDGVVTRYTCAIATVSPDNQPPVNEPISPPPRSFEPVVPRIKEAPQARAQFAHQTVSNGNSDNLDEIQRHNMLQQQLIRRMQNESSSPNVVVAPAPGRRFSQEIRKENNRSPTSPYNFTSGRVCALKALNESSKAQEKIHMFEEKRNSGVSHQQQQQFRPLNVPAVVTAKVNPVLRQERSPIRNASPIDSSDEYLMSCASKPSRNLVLSKSESWHQLALARGAGGLAPVSQLKPPKPKSPSSLRLSKQFEASSASDNVRKMEEKIQRYFQAGGGGGAATGHTTTTTTTAATSSSSSTSSSQLEETTTIKSNNSKAKAKRNLQSKKSMNSLMRSQTMPHIFDDNVDVDLAFDSIFKEATRADNRH